MKHIQHSLFFFLNFTSHQENENQTQKMLSPDTKTILKKLESSKGWWGCGERSPAWALSRLFLPFSEQYEDKDDQEETSRKSAWKREKRHFSEALSMQQNGAHTWIWPEILRSYVQGEKQTNWTQIMHGVDHRLVNLCYRLGFYLSKPGRLWQ